MPAAGLRAVPHPHGLDVAINIAIFPEIYCPPETLRGGPPHGSDMALRLL